MISIRYEPSIMDELSSLDDDTTPAYLEQLYLDGNPSPLNFFALPA